MSLAIIIINKSNNKLLFGCLNSIKDKSAYKDYNIYVGDTGSTPEELEEIKEYLSTNFTGKAKLLLLPFYNFAKNNNDVVKKYTQGEELLLFCNNDIELIDDVISEYVKLSSDKTVGTIGCKLLYANRKIQHVGQYIVVRGMQYKDKLYGNFDITHNHLDEDEDTVKETRIVIGNTGGFMCVRRELFDKTNGFNENYLECFEDVEFNLSLVLLEYRNICVCDKKAFHFTSQTRNLDSKKKDKADNDFKKTLLPFLTAHLHKFLKKQMFDDKIMAPNFIMKVTSNPGNDQRLRDFAKQKDEHIWNVSQTYKIQQKKQEFLWLLDKIKNIPDYKGIGIDIGTYDGGSSAGLSFLCKELYTIDLVKRYESIRFDADCEHIFIEGNSHEEQTKEKLKTFLNGRLADFIFIDGDHTCLGVKQDYEMYKELIKENGIIAFHDIVVHPEHPTCTVHEFWNEVKETTKIEEIIVPPEIWGGIGIVRV